MSLALPADVEPFLGDDMAFERLRGSAVYCLALDRPDNLPTVWDHSFDTRPSYFDELQAAEQVLYVGSAKDLLRRLEEHNNGDVRTTVLTEVCDIARLRNVVWVDDSERRFIVESQFAIMLRNNLDNTFVHQQ